MEVDLPAGMSSWQRNGGETITVKIGMEGLSGCRTDLFARPDGRISGWVVDDTGSGLGGFVTIKPADAKEAEAASRRGGLPGYTTEDGSFTLWLLPPGRYRLSFHPKVDGRVNLGVPTVWSEVVELGFGQQIENFRFEVSTIRKTPR
ncbi:MAG: carboxypeptidase-like regulatory domain-containing protein [Acidobacteriota bacterium]